MQHEFCRKTTIILLVMVVIASGILCGCQLLCEHAWVDATCLAPKTCSICELTEGELAAHQWMDADCTDPKTCSVCNTTEGNPLGHSWVDADCTSPKTCAVCNATEGDPLGHLWVDADCTDPKTCAVCNATEGDPLGHLWVDADCTDPKTCADCNATEGDPLGHSPGEPFVVRDYVEATETTAVTCTVCNGIVDTSVNLITKMHDYNLLLLDGSGIAKRFNKILNELSPDCPYGLEYQYYPQVDDETGEVYYTDRFFQIYNGRVIIFDPWKYDGSAEQAALNEQDERFYAAKAKIDNFESHTNGVYSWYSYSQYFGGYLVNGEYPGIKFTTKNNEYSKDLMIAALMTVFPELTPESAWGVFQEARSGDRPNRPGPYVRNGLGIRTSASNTQTNRNDDFENCNLFTLLVFTIPEDSPFNVESETAYP